MNTLYELTKVDNHNFKLIGMAAGDWFLGCRDCSIRLPANTLGVLQCRNCLGTLKEYHVTADDITPKAS